MIPKYIAVGIESTGHSFDVRPFCKRRDFGMTSLCVLLETAMCRTTKIMGWILDVAIDFAEAQGVRGCSLMLAETWRLVHDHTHG